MVLFSYSAIFLKYMKEIKLCIRDVLFLFLLDFKVSQLRISRMLFNIWCVSTQFPHLLYERAAIKSPFHFGNEKHIITDGSPCLHDLGCFVIRVSSGLLKEVF